MAALRLRKYEPKYVYHSDFMRDSETAEIIARENNIANEADFDARTWDVGVYSGKPEKEVNPRIEELYRRPWEIPPGSTESFNTFASRWQKFLDKRMDVAVNIEAMRPIVIVTHGRNLAATQAYLSGIDPLNCYMPYPAGMGIISVENDGGISYTLQEPTERVIDDV